MTPEIEAAPVATEEVRALIAELDRALSAEYPPAQRHGLALEAIFPSGGGGSRGGPARGRAERAAA